MRRALALALLLAAAASITRGATPARPAAPPGATLFGAPETVVKRALLIVGQNPHGEFVLLRRGDAMVARTTLCSALLGRGLQSIRAKERARWPEGTPGHEDSEKYLAALDAGEDAALAAYAKRTNPNDDRRKMMMELVQGGGRSFFAVYAIDARRTGDTFEILSATPVVVQDASPEYVSGAMRTQAGNAFQLEGAELEKLFTGK